MRPATVADAPEVAAIWCSGWRDGHLGGVPDELVAARTPESFDKRAHERVGDTTVAIADGSVAGFIMVVGDEVEQVYVAAQHRGQGVAPALLSAAEQQVVAKGFSEAWLAVHQAGSRRDNSNTLVTRPAFTSCVNVADHGVPVACFAK